MAVCATMRVTEFHRIRQGNRVRFPHLSFWQEGEQRAGISESLLCVRTPYLGKGERTAHGLSCGLLSTGKRHTGLSLLLRRQRIFQWSSTLWLEATSPHPPNEDVDVVLTLITSISSVYEYREILFNLA